MKLASRLNRIAESATIRMGTLTRELIAQGRDIVNLTAGEPDFGPPACAIEAVEEALKKGLWKYTDVAGTKELRELVAQTTSALHPQIKPWQVNNVIVCNGGKQALYNAFMAILDPGDEVLVPSPFWVSYPEMVKMADGECVEMRTLREEGFKLTPDLLLKTLRKHPKARALILNSPSNPAGIVYTKNELAALGEIILKNTTSDFLIVSDEIYEKIVLRPHVFASFVEACPELAERTITINGLSKGAALTGWRIGWAVAHPSLIKAMNTIQGQVSSNINTLAQAAATSVLKNKPDLSKQVEIFEKRLALVETELHKSSNLDWVSPGGAFYVFFRLKQTSSPAELVCEKLLTAAGVGLVPGAPFGEEHYLRMSFATSEKALSEGTKRIVQFANDELKKR